MTERNSALELFVKLIERDFYFNDEKYGDNVWEWDKKNEVVTIYCPNEPEHISGLGNIGVYAASLNLCCSLHWDVFKERLEIIVH